MDDIPQLTNTDIEKMMSFFDESDAININTPLQLASSNGFNQISQPQFFPTTPTMFTFQNMLAPTQDVKPDTVVPTFKRKLSDSGEMNSEFTPMNDDLAASMFMNANPIPTTPLQTTTPVSLSIKPLNISVSSNTAFGPSKIPQPVTIPLSPQTDMFREAPPYNQVPNQPVQISQQPEPSTQLLNKVQSYYMQQQEQLQQIRHTQKQVLSNPQKESFEMLNNEQELLKKQLDAELKALQDLESTIILSPQELRKSFYLIQSIEAQSMQLELYHQELQQLVLQPGVAPRCFAVLAITEQPLPMVITKGKALEDPVGVQLMTGANINFSSATEVRAQVLMDNPQAKNSTKPIDNDVEKMDDFTRTAKFNLKFNHGTRKSLATLKFHVQLQVSGNQKLQLESNISSPLVVITNECQYEESDGVLLKTDAFGTQTHIAWCLFANKLQRHFLKATRQDSAKPQRFLSRYEIEYIHAKFFDGVEVVSLKAFDDFWNWFGKGLQKLRYARHLANMWQSGYIYGFIEREGVNAALINQQPGTFLIRLSERHPGSFAIGYVIEDNDPDKRVRHYLVRNEDLFGGKKSLPEFLMECPQFSKFLVVSFEFNGGAKHRIVEKDVALEPYGVKKVIPDTPKNGYDGQLVGGMRM